MSETKPSAGAMRAAVIIDSHLGANTVEENATIIDREHFAGPEAMDLLERAANGLLVPPWGWLVSQIRLALAKAQGEEPPRPYHGPRDLPKVFSICPNPDCEGDVRMKAPFKFCPLCGTWLQVFTPPPEEVQGA